jgi:hypothetical protein
MTRFIVALSLVLAAVPSFAARRRTASAAPPFPPCASVEGTPAVAFSRDGGATLVTPSQKLEGIGYSYGLAALSSNDLLAIHKQTLSLSTDAGCSWTPIGTLEGDQLFRITPAASGRNYIWNDSRDELLRFDYLPRTLTKLKSPASPIGLGVDPANGDHVLLGANDGTVWESFNAGDSWTRIGGLPAQQFPLYYRFAFDPTDINHVVAGVANNGAYVSNDRGRTWTKSQGLGRGSVNVFSIAIANGNGQVWAMGIDLAESDANVPSHGRHIYFSEDRGASFRVVVDESADVHIVNQPVIAVDPQNPYVLYFIFGTYFQGYGTDIYRYNDTTKTLTKFHNDFDDINAIVFSQRDSNVMYFGLETEKRTAP